MNANVVLVKKKRLDSDRQDKKCGKSGIPDKAKCTKKNTPATAEGKGPDIAGVVKGTAALAAAFGLGTVAYGQIQENYRKGFTTSGKRAAKMADDIEVEDLKPGAKAITFSIGGLYGYEGKEAARKGENYLDYKLKNEILGDKDNPGGDHHMIKHPNLEFNTEPPITSYESGLGHIESTIAHYTTIMKPVLVQGYNPEAVKLASEAIAYNRKYPDKPINFIGHSAGGMIANEAHEILRTQGIKTNVVNLAAGHFGITPERPEVSTIFRDDDLYLQTIPGGVRGGVGVKTGNPPSPDAHRVRSYMNDEGVRSQIRRLVKTQK